MANEIKNEYGQTVGKYERTRDGFIIEDNYGNVIGKASKQILGSEYDLYNTTGD